MLIMDPWIMDFLTAVDTKGQLISKGLFAIYEKTNKTI